MKVYIASDHAGFSFKSEMVKYLKDRFNLVDLGPANEDRVDYPDFAKKVSDHVSKDPGSYGILICGSGQGMAMGANRNKGIRAALCWDVPSVTLSREHNDANVLCLGARLIPLGLAQQIADKFLSTPFAGGRHLTRVQKLDC